jgi:hypothetical protein
MSLINDALKKAARQRAEAQGDLPPMPGGGGGGGARGPMKKQTMILIGAGALVLVVVSAVVTGALMATKPTAKVAPMEAPAASAPAHAPAAKIEVTSPVIAVATPPPEVRAPSPSPVPSPTPTLVAKAAPSPVPQIVAHTEGPADTKGAPRQQIQDMVNAYHVAGVRPQGANGKAIIDGHLYRVDELMDGPTGLRLVGIDYDHLTFKDAEGATYLKVF